MQRANVLLADDHPLMLMAMTMIVAKRHQVVGTCENGNDLVSMANGRMPDVVVTDIDMPELNGIDAAAEIMANVPNVKVIFYTAKTNTAGFRNAMHTGAHGYVVKSEPAETLLTAIECVLNGEQFVSESVQQLAQEFSAAADAAVVPDLSLLTHRQMQILQMIGQGASSKQIAYQLNLSVKTVEFHRGNLMHRFGRFSMPELLLMAVQQGFIRYAEGSDKAG